MGRGDNSPAQSRCPLRHVAGGCALQVLKTTGGSRTDTHYELQLHRWLIIIVGSPFFMFQSAVAVVKTDAFSVMVVFVALFRCD